MPTTTQTCDCRKGTITDVVTYKAHGGEKRTSRCCAPCATWLMTLDLRDRQRVEL